MLINYDTSTTFNYLTRGLKFRFDVTLLNVIFALISGCSVARSSRLLWEQEVAGSNPATPTITLSVSGCGAAW